MKTKKFDKKLNLNKTTIVTLGKNQMKVINGGTLPTEMFCKPTNWGCPTVERFC
jgi:hypothetical protein